MKPVQITPAVSAQALGVDTFDLAVSLRNFAGRTLATLAEQVVRSDCELDDLEHFDEKVARARALFASAIACTRAS